VSGLPINPALLAPVSGATPGSPSPKPVTPPITSGPTFADTLAGAQAPTFSKHALERLQRRGIDLDDQALGRLTDGIARAADKGSRNSVVFVDGTAFVASVQNNTVITAVAPEHMRSQVFTNIDSAVIA
jgi:flagellar operon protein